MKLKQLHRSFLSLFLVSSFMMSLSFLLVPSSASTSGPRTHRHGSSPLAPPTFPTTPSGPRTSRQPPPTVPTGTDAGPTTPTTPPAAVVLSADEQSFLHDSAAVVVAPAIAEGLMRLEDPVLPPTTRAYGRPRDFQPFDMVKIDGYLYCSTVVIPGALQHNYLRYVHNCLRMSMCVCVLCTCTCMCVSLSVCMYAYLYVCGCVHVHVCVIISVRVCVCVC